MASEAHNQEPTTETTLYKTSSVAEPDKHIETVIKHYEAENVKEPIGGDNIFKSPSVGKVSSEKFPSELSTPVEICEKEVSDNLDGKETEDQVSESLGAKETEGQLPKISDGKEAEVYEAEHKEENKIENSSNASITLDNTEKTTNIEPVTFEDHISRTSPEEDSCDAVSSETAKKELHMASASEDLSSNLEEMEPKGDMEEITTDEKIGCDVAVNVSLKSDNLSEANKEEAEKGEEMNASPVIALPVKPIDETSEEVSSSDIKEIASLDGLSEKEEKAINIETNLPEAPREARNDEAGRKFDINNLGLPVTEGASDIDMAIPSLNEEDEIHMHDTAKGQQDDHPVVHETEATGGTQLHVEEPNIMHNIDEVERNPDSSHLVLTPTEGAPGIALTQPCQIDADNLETESGLIAHDLNEEDEVHLSETAKGQHDAPPLETKTDYQEPTTETILNKISSIAKPEDMEHSEDTEEEITNNEEIGCAAPVHVTPKSDYLSDPNKEQAEKGEEMNAFPGITLAVKPIDETCVADFRSEEVTSSGIKEIASQDGQSEKEEKVNTETNLAEAPRETRIDEPIDASNPKDKQPFDEKNVPAVDLNEEDEIHQNDTAEGQQDALPIVHEKEDSEEIQPSVEEPKIIHDIDEADRKYDSSDLGLPCAERALDMDLAPPCQIDAENLGTESRLITNNEEDEIHLSDSVKDAPPQVHETEASEGTQLHVEEPKVMHIIDEADRELDSTDLVLPQTEGASDIDLAPPCQTDVDNLESESRLIANNLNEEDESHLSETAKGPQDSPLPVPESETSEGTQLPVEEKKVVHNIDEADRKLDSGDIVLPPTKGASDIDLAPPCQIDADNNETESRLVANDLNEEDETHLYGTAKEQQGAPQLVHEIEASEGSQLSVEEPKIMHDKDEADKRLDSSDHVLNATEGEPDMDLAPPHHIDAEILEIESRLVANDLNEEDEIPLYGTAKDQHDPPQLPHDIEASEGGQLSVEEPKIMHDQDEADKRLDSSDLGLPPTEGKSDMDLAPPCEIDGQQDAPTPVHEKENSEGIELSVEEPNIIHNIDAADRKLDSSDLGLPPTEGESDKDLAPPCEIDGQQDSPTSVHEKENSEGIELSVEEPNIIHNIDEADRKLDSSDLGLPPTEGESDKDLAPPCEIDGQQDSPTPVHEKEDSEGIQLTVDEPNLMHNKDEADRKLDSGDLGLPPTEGEPDMDLALPCEIDGQQDAPPPFHEKEDSEGIQLTVDEPNLMHNKDEADRKLDSGDLGLPPTEGEPDMDLALPCEIDGQQDAPPPFHEKEDSEGIQLSVEEPNVKHNIDEADRKVDSSDIGLSPTGGESDMDLAPPCEIGDQQDHPSPVHEKEDSEGIQLSVEEPNVMHNIDEADRKLDSSDLGLPPTAGESDMDLTPPSQIDVDNLEIESRLIANDLNEEDTIHLHDMSKVQRDAPPLVPEVEASEGTQLYVEEPKTIHDTDETERQLDSSDRGLPLTEGASDMDLAPPCQIDAENLENESNLDSKEELGIVQTNTEDKLEQIDNSPVESHHISITNDANTKVIREEIEIDNPSTTVYDEKIDDLRVQESEQSNAPQMEEKSEATDLMDGKQSDMNDNIDQNSKPEEHGETGTLDKEAEELTSHITNKEHTIHGYAPILTPEESQEINDKAATGCDGTDFTSPTDSGSIDELPSEGKALSEKLLISSSELNEASEAESGTEHILESLEGKEIQGQILENSDGKQTEGHASEISKGKETEGYESKSSDGKETQDGHVEKGEYNSIPETQPITEEILGEGYRGPNGGMRSEETEIDIPAANSHQSLEVEVSELEGDNNMPKTIMLDNTEKITSVEPVTFEDQLHGPSIEEDSSHAISLNMTKNELYVPSASEDIVANHEDIVSRAMEEEVTNNEKNGLDAPVDMPLKSDHLSNPYKEDIIRGEEMSAAPMEETCLEADVAGFGTKGISLLDEQSEKEEKAINREINLPEVPTEAGKDENIFYEKNISADDLKEEDGTSQYDATKDQPEAPPLIPETEVREENQISVGEPEKRYDVNEADTMSRSSDRGLTPIEGASSVDMVPHYQIDAEKSESTIDSPKELHIIAENNTKDKLQQNDTGNETIEEETNFNSNIQESEYSEDTQIEEKTEAKADLELLGHGQTDTSNKEDEEIANMTDKEQNIQNYPETLTTEESKETSEEAAREVVTEDEPAASVRENDLLDSPATPEEVREASIEEDKENGSQIKEEHCDKTIKSTNITDEGKLENSYGEDEGKEDNAVVSQICEVYTNAEAKTGELDNHNIVLPTSSVETDEDISQVESEEDPAQPKEVSTGYTRGEAGSDESDSSNTVVPALVATFEEIDHQHQDLTKPKEVCISDEPEKIELDSLNTELPTSRVEAVDGNIHQENEDITKPKEVSRAYTHEEAETNELDSPNNLLPTSIVEAVGENQEIIQENEDTMKPNEIIILEKESNNQHLDETQKVEETKAETLNSIEKSTAASTMPSPTEIVENEMPSEEHKSIEEISHSLPDEPEIKKEFSSTGESAVTAITKEMENNDCEENKMQNKDQEQDFLIFKDSTSEPTGSKPHEASKIDESYNEMSSISESDVKEHDDRAYQEEQVFITNASSEELPTISRTDIEEDSDISNLETHVTHGSIKRMEDQGTKSVEHQIDKTSCEYVEVMHENFTNESSQVNEYVEKNYHIIQTPSDIKDEGILKELHSVSEADMPSHEVRDIGLLSMQSIDTVDSSNKAEEIPVPLAENPKTEEDASVIEAPDEMSKGKEQVQDMKSISLQNIEKTVSDEKSEEIVLQSADHSNPEQESSTTEDPKETTEDKEHIEDMTNIIFEKAEETSGKLFMKEADDCNDKADALVKKESSLEDVHIDEKTFHVSSTDMDEQNPLGINSSSKDEQVEIKQLEETSGPVYQTEPLEIKEIISEREQEDNTDKSQHNLKGIEEISGINHGSIDDVEDSRITSIQKEAEATNELQETREEQELETLDSIKETMHKGKIDEAGAEMSSPDQNCLTSESSRKDVDDLSISNVTAVIDELQESKDATDLKSDMPPGVLESEAKLYNAEAPSEAEKGEIKEDAPQAEIGAENLPNEEMTETRSIEDSISREKDKDEGSSGLAREAIPVEPQTITVEETSGTSNKENNNEKVSSSDVDTIQTEKERGEDEYGNEAGEIAELVAEGHKPAEGSSNTIHDETNEQNEDQATFAANTSDVKVNEVTEQDSITEGDHSKIQDPSLGNLKEDCIATKEVQMIDKPLPEVSITNVLRDIEMMPESLKTTAQAETQKQQELNDSNAVPEATNLNPDLKFTIHESKTIEQDSTTLRPVDDPTLDLTQGPTVTNVSDAVEGESLAQLSEVHDDYVIKDVAEKEDPVGHESSNNKKVEIENSGSLAVSTDKDLVEIDSGESEPVISSKHEDIPAAAIDLEEVKQVYPREAVPEPHSKGSAEKGYSHDHEETPHSPRTASDLGHGFAEENVPEPRDTDSQDQHATSHVIHHVQESPMRSQEGSVDDVERTHQTAELKLPTMSSSESLSTPEVDRLITKDASQVQEKIEAEGKTIMDEPEESTEKILPAEMSEESTWEKADYPSETSKLKTQPAEGEVKLEDAVVEKEEHGEQKEGNSGSEVVCIGEKDPDDDTNKVIATEVKDMSSTTVSNDMTSVQVDPEESTETLISREGIEVKADESEVEREEQDVLKGKEPVSEALPMSEKDEDGHTFDKSVAAHIIDGTLSATPDDKILVQGYPEDHSEKKNFSEDKETNTDKDEAVEEQHIPKEGNPEAEAPLTGEKDPDVQKEEKLDSEVAGMREKDSIDNWVLVKEKPEDFRENVTDREDKCLKSDSKSEIADAEMEKLKPVNTSEAVAESERFESADERRSSHDLNAEKIESPTPENLHALPHNTGLSTETIMKVDDSDIDIISKNQEEKESFPLATEKQMAVDAELKVSQEPEKDILQLQQKEAAESSGFGELGSKPENSNNEKTISYETKEGNNLPSEDKTPVVEHFSIEPLSEAKKEEVHAKNTGRKEDSKAVRSLEHKDEEVKDEKEHQEENIGSDLHVMTGTSRDTEVKVSPKKSHNILSGVIKQSISKMKKAITCTNNQPMPQSPR